MRRPALVAAGLVFAAFNLRASVAAVAPVLPEVQRADHLSSTGGGLLNAAPVACFGLFALATPTLLRRFGADRLLWLVVAGVAAGTAVRSVAGVFPLFFGTLVVGAAIGVGNVVLPGLVKRDFPERVALLTGLYAMALSGGAGLAAGLTVPLEHAGGLSWRGGLAIWAVPAVAALVLWPPGRVHREAGARPRGAWVLLRRSPVAWAVTAFMGLQSLGFYALFAFIPTLLEGGGSSATLAGVELSVSAVASLLAAFATPTVAGRLGRAWPPVAVAVGLNAVALAGLALDPRGLGPVTVWMIVLGAGQGAMLSLALGFIVLRAPDPTQAANLSTMAQGIGYLVAAAGPFAVGALHQLTGGWSVPLATLGAALAVALAAGVVASGDRLVPAAPQAAPAAP